MHDEMMIRDGAAERVRNFHPQLNPNQAPNPRSNPNPTPESHNLESHFLTRDGIRNP